MRIYRSKHLIQAAQYGRACQEALFQGWWELAVFYARAAASAALRGSRGLGAK